VCGLTVIPLETIGFYFNISLHKNNRDIIHFTLELVVACLPVM